MAKTVTGCWFMSLAIRRVTLSASPAVVGTGSRGVAVDAVPEDVGFAEHADDLPDEFVRASW